MEVLKESRRRGISYTQGRLTGLVTNLLWNCLLKHVIEGKIPARMEVKEK